MKSFINECYKLGKNPNKLVFFIHGYNGSPQSIDYAVKSLAENLNDAIIVVPQAPEVCEKDNNNFQWFSFFETDPDIQFKNTSLKALDIFEIFNKMGSKFSLRAKELNEFISQKQKEFGISDENTYLIGFSQGAMLSLYASLSRKGLLAGCVFVAGIIGGKDKLETEIISKPKILVLHGEDDVSVQYKTLPYSLEWMQKQNLDYELHIYPDLAHRMNDEEMKKAAEFIKS